MVLSVDMMMVDGAYGDGGNGSDGDGGDDENVASGTKPVSSQYTMAFKAEETKENSL